MRNLLFAINRLNLVECVNVRRQAAVEAQDRLVNERGQRQAVKDLCAVAPDIDASVLAQALVIETIRLSDLAALVVAADQRNLVRIPHFESQEQKECFNRIKASVNKVTHEEVVGPGALASHLEELHHIVELTMDVTADLQTS